MPREVFGRDYAFMPRADMLTFEEITRIARIAVAHGVEKIRLTGGEPLLRRGLEELIAMLGALRTPDGRALDMALTTNGSALAARAQSLRDAGLRRITVSLDSLDDATFGAMNDVDFPVVEVLRGIAAAHDAGFDEVVPSAEIVRRIDAEMPLEEVAPNYNGETSVRWRYRDGTGEIGVISSVTGAFCHSCTRARISTEGKLYTCLFASSGHDLRAMMRSGCSDEQLSTVIARIWHTRTDRYSELRSAHANDPSPNATGKIEMSYIGG